MMLRRIANETRINAELTRMMTRKNFAIPARSGITNKNNAKRSCFVCDPLPWLSELTKDREWIRDGIEELGLVVKVK